MMELINIKQGEDYKLSVTVYDTDNNVVDLGSALKIRVGLNVRNILVYKYLDSSLEPTISGYGEVTINPSSDSTMIDVFVDRTQSHNFALGEYKLSILVEYTDVELDNKAVEYETIVLGSILSGKLRDETLA